MSPRAAWRLEAFGYPAVYDYSGGKADWIAAGLPTEGRLTHPARVIEVLDRRPPTCTPDEPAAVVLARLDRLHDVCVVVNDADVVQGRLRRGHLDPTDTRLVADVMEPGPTTVRADADVAATTERMLQHDATTLIVTDPDGVLLGLFTPTPRDTPVDPARPT
jgi:CBS domain-containing protein